MPKLYFHFFRHVIILSLGLEFDLKAWKIVAKSPAAWEGTANKNFIGIVEGEQRTADQSTSNLRLNEIGVP